MKFFPKVLPLVLVILVSGVTASWAQAQFVPPWTPDVAPRWTPIPQVPGVSYVPDLAYDLFRYANQFYFYQNGRWLLGDGLSGPWREITNPPQVFYNLGPAYFKSPPGWAKGKKTGWGGAPAPPGQMKKMEGGGSLPPGQMKKMQ
jgi:hypothetical protein